MFGSFNLHVVSLTLCTKGKIVMLNGKAGPVFGPVLG